MDIKILIGKVFIEIVVHQFKETISFTTTDGEVFQMFHIEECCETVLVEDIVGDLDDLIGSPILRAEEATNNENRKEGGDESHTWTFYKFATIKGYVDIRWYGESNGCYSEKVEFEKIKP